MDLQDSGSVWSFCLDFSWLRGSGCTLVLRTVHTDTFPSPPLTQAKAPACASVPLFLVCPPYPSFPSLLFGKVFSLSKTYQSRPNPSVPMSGHPALCGCLSQFHPDLSHLERQPLTLLLLPTTVTFLGTWVVPLLLAEMFSFFLTPGCDR